MLDALWVGAVFAMAQVGGPAASPPAFAGLGDHLDASAARTPETTEVRLEGVVLRPDGSPARGAVVVAGGGGRAVAGESGFFRLDCDVPHAVTRLRVVATLGDSLRATEDVEFTASFSQVGVGALRLSESSGCSPAWQPTFGQVPGLGGFYFQVLPTVRDFAVFDDGSGSALYVAGHFASAGGAVSEGLAKWDGERWSGVAGGVTGFPAEVHALAVFDDGTGEALYVAGGFTGVDGTAASNIARWDGSAWTEVGGGLSSAGISVEALAVFDDGSGEALFAGGRFSSAGGSPVSAVAKWDGSTWSPLGAGVAHSSSFAAVHGFAVFDDGDGPSLFVGGHFDSAGGSAASNLAKWNGSTWTPVPGGLNGTVLALRVHDDGHGAALFVAGDFTEAAGRVVDRVASWDGSTWSKLGQGLNERVFDLAVFDFGAGPRLVAGGLFSLAGSEGGGLAAWNGTEWVALGSSLDVPVHALGVVEGEEGGTLFVGGPFFTGGYRAPDFVARWEGGALRPVGRGLDGRVAALEVFDDGDGPALYAAGGFVQKEGLTLNHVGRWDGEEWSSVGTGTDLFVDCLAVYDDGTGEALFAGGGFSSAGGVPAARIAKWDGLHWTPLGAGANGRVRALFVHDDGSGAALYAGGDFTTMGGVPANRIARWDGTSWEPVGRGTAGGGVLGGLNITYVRAFAEYDDGTGTALYAAGRFHRVETGVARRIAKWDGSVWSPVGDGVGDSSALAVNWVTSLAVFDDGGGAALYAGGLFTKASGVFAKAITKWDGAAWTPVSNGLSTPLGSSRVEALFVHDDGTGEALFAGGFFINASGVLADYVAKWDGQSWAALGGGASSTVDAFARFDDGSGASLFAGGSFSSARDSGDSFLAKWGCSDVSDRVRD